MRPFKHIQASSLEEAAALVEPQMIPTVANVMVNLVPSFKELSAKQIASISHLLAQDAITFAQAREVLEVVDKTDRDPQKVVDELGVRQSTNTAELAGIVDEVLLQCADQVRQYQEGNRKVVGYLVGQCMRATRGAGNPKLFNQLLRECLEAL